MKQKTWQKDVLPESLSSAKVHAEFKQLVTDGCPLKPAGQAKRDPSQLLRGFLPKNKIDLFGNSIYLTNVRHDNQFRFFVAYVQLKHEHKNIFKRPLYPRIFYKDSSLVWRVATHYINSDKEHWIGKGDVKPVEENGEIVWYSAEETTNLPYEIQNALDAISRRVARPRSDRRALSLILRNAPDNRVRPYADFSEPRRLAMKNRRWNINGNAKIAWFDKANNPSSLKFAAGFSPNFKTGLIDASSSRSKLYGGRILRFRIASENAQVQYYFMKSPKLAWIIPPQPLDDMIISYGARAIDANVDDNLCLPGYEYHFYDDDKPPQLFTQIPTGFAGKTSAVDPQRAETSQWTHAMPVIKRFIEALPALTDAASLDQT